MCGRASALPNFLRGAIFAVITNDINNRKPNVLPVVLPTLTSQSTSISC